MKYDSTINILFAISCVADDELTLFSCYLFCTDNHFICLQKKQSRNEIENL